METASAALSAPSHPAPATPAPDSSTNCTPQPAPYCVAEPQECTHNPSARGGARIYGTPARPHDTRTARSSAVAACSALSAPSSQPACPPHPVAHPPETPMGFRCPMPLRTHLPPAAQHCRGGTRPVRAPDVNSRCEMQPSFCPTLTCLSHVLVSLATVLLNASMLLVVPSAMHVASRALK